MKEVETEQLSEEQKRSLSRSFRKLFKRSFYVSGSSREVQEMLCRKLNFLRGRNSEGVPADRPLFEALNNHNN